MTISNKLKRMQIHRQMSKCFARRTPQVVNMIFTELSVELLVLIFSHLTERDKHTVLLVCSVFHRALIPCMHVHKCQVGNVSVDNKFHNRCDGRRWAWFADTGNGGTLEPRALASAAGRTSGDLSGGDLFVQERLQHLAKSMMKHAWLGHGLRLLRPEQIFGVYLRTDHADTLFEYDFNRWQAEDCHFGPDTELETED